MLHIELLCVGKLGEPHWADACGEYVKRLTAHAKVTVTELPEGHPVVSRIPENACVTALCLDGETPDSEQLSRFLAERAMNGDSRLCFLIGGSEGLPRAAVEKARYRLSLSRLTFPHALGG